MALTEIATDEVVTASTDTDVREVLDLMDDNGVGSVVVTDGEEPTGIVTDRTIALHFREADSVDDLTVGDVMTEDIVTIEQDATHFEALERMRDEGIRRIPVVDDGSLVGIVTLDDMLVVCAAELSNASDVVEQQAGPL